MRSGNLFSKRGSAVLDAPEPPRASAAPNLPGGKRRAAVSEMPLRRDSAYAAGHADDYTDNFDEDGEFIGKTRRGLRISLRGVLLPKTLWGRIATGTSFLIAAAAAIAGVLELQSYLLHDEHFTIPGSSAIQIAGNSRLSRAQLLSVFGEDVDRNVFTVPLTQRRAELESLPWVAHATVMRLLPNRVRVAIVERTPAAFVRQGSQIGLVDASGVLLDMASPDSDAGPGAAKPTHYSFPVLTGIAAADPLSVRAARMKIYLSFLQALDATGENLSQRVSEVDLSDPEDVRATVSSTAPDSPADKAGDILIHFGDEDFLERYRRYQAHLVEWRTQYPRLAAVDLRYDRQAVLEMQPGAPLPPADAPTAPVANAKVTPLPAKPAASKAAPATTKTAISAASKSPVAIKPSANVATKAATAPKAVAKSPIAATNAKPSTPLTTAFPVTPLGVKLSSKPAASTTPQQGAPR